MADETTTGATKEVAIDADAQVAQDKRKKIIKTVVIVVLVSAAAWLIYKYVLKK